MLTRRLDRVSTIADIGTSLSLKASFSIAKRNSGIGSVTRASSRLLFVAVTETPDFIFTVVQFQSDTSIQHQQRSAAGSLKYERTMVVLEYRLGTESCAIAFLFTLVFWRRKHAAQEKERKREKEKCSWESYPLHLERRRTRNMVKPHSEVVSQQWCAKKVSRINIEKWSLRVEKTNDVSIWHTCNRF